MASFVSMDKFGRIVLPKAIRRQVGARAFSVQVERRKLVFEPLLSLDELVGCAPPINGDPHKEHAEETKRESRRRFMDLD